MSTGSTVKVWDIFIRAFHWSLVIFFTIAYFSDDESRRHTYSGYIIFGLIGLRILWGLIGSKYARFNNFIYAPKAVANYLKSLLSKHPKHYVGHNPAGGWMVIALLVCMFVVTFSGLEVYAIEKKSGPLARISQMLNGDTAADETEAQKKAKEHAGEFWEDLHEVSANLAVFLIIFHIMGVIVASRLHKENLVKAMITGKKKVE